MRVVLSLCFCLGLVAGAVAADTVMPVRTIRAQEVIGPADLKLHPGTGADGYSMIEEVAGLEARVALYPGRPVRRGDVGPPALVDRNQIVGLVYDRGGLVIRTEGRVLSRAGLGDLVKVMNMASRSTVMGRVLADGSVSVSE